MCKDVLTSLNSMSFPLLGILESGSLGLEAQSLVEEQKIPTGIQIE